MTKRGFTLVELLVVIAIMGFLGTAMVGGYRQMQRGMEDRGVRENVSNFMRAAYQRACIDRQPTVVCYWNECLRSKTDDENEIIVGRAIAVRRQGRLTAISGNYLIDEFCDINPYEQFGDEDETSAASGQTAERRLYKMNDAASGKVPYSNVRDQPVTQAWNDPYFITLMPVGLDDNSESGERLPLFAFEKTGSGGDASWAVGDSYGFEFASIILPHGYIFDEVDYSSDARNPVSTTKTFVFTPGGTGKEFKISALRPGTDGYTLMRKDAGSTENPVDKRN